MAVFRVEKNKGYTVMSNHHLRNKELSLKAKGLLSQMLSLPEDWDYTLAGLSLINREKIDAIREAVRELENVPVPKDLSKVKTKVAFNLTKRQILCFSVALLMGLPLFFLFKDSAGTSLAAMAMIVVMLPCFLVAMYEKHGQPLEVVVKNIIQTKLTRPKVRPYQTENLYALLEKQRALEKEVSAIVKRTDKKDAGSRRKQA